MEIRSDTNHPGAAAPSVSGCAQNDMKVLEDLEAYFLKYAREQPQTMALACIAVGFVLGWKLKPW